MVGDFGDPQVGVDVVDVEDIENVEAKPYVAQSAADAAGDMTVFVVQQSVGEAEVQTAVGGHAEIGTFTADVGWREGESAGVVPAQESLPACGAWEVVGEKDGGIEQLVGGTWHTDAVDGFFGFHQSNADPGIGAWHEFAVELEVDSGCVAA